MSNENAIVVEELPVFPRINETNQNKTNKDLIVELNNRVDNLEQIIHKHEQVAKQMNKTFSRKQAKKEMNIQKSVIMKTIKTLVRGEVR